MENQEEVFHTEDGIPYRKLNVDEKEFKLFNTDRPYRLAEESFEEYKVRRRFNNQVKKLKLKGEVVWPSHKWGAFTQAKAEYIKQLIEEEKLKEKTNGNN